jgi:hypothetical protein
MEEQLPTKAFKPLLFLGVVCVFVLALALVAGAQGQTEPTTGSPGTVLPAPTASPVPTVDPSVQEREQLERALKAKKRKLRKHIRLDRRTTWYWQDVMLKPRIGKRRNLARISEVSTLQRHAHLWHKRKMRAQYQAKHPPMLWAWLCIHSHEAAWNNPGLTWDGRPSPYHGGLQMDWRFMSMYGPKLLARKGPAGNWTPLEQIWVAVNAAFRHGRGFWPWPNTAHACGLI